MVMLAGVLSVLPVALRSADAAVTTDGLLLYGVNSNTNPQLRSYTNSSNSFSSAGNTVAGATGVTAMIRTSPNKEEAVAGYVTSGGQLYVMCFNGSAWSNEWNVSVGGTGTTRRFDIAYETKTGDVIVLYSTNAATTNELAYRTKSSSTGCGSANWSSATSLDPVRTSGIVHWVKMAWDRRGEYNLITAVWADANSDLSAMQWSGASWGNEPSSALETSLEVASGAQDVDDFDVEYESTSGDVKVVWANSAGSDGTGGVRDANCTGGTATCTWSAAATPATFADDATNLDLAANPNSDELVFASVGNAGSDLQAGYWSGSAWTNTANLDSDAATPLAGTRLVSVAWLVAGATARSIITYNDNGATNTGWVVGSGSTFTVQTDASPSPSFANPQKWYDLQSDPLTKDRLMFTVSDTNSDLFSKRLVMTSTPGFTWTDSDGAALETGLAQATTSPFSFAHWRYLPLVQSAYRWYDNTNALQPTTPLAAQSTAAALASTPAPVRLRASASLAARGVTASSERVRLQYATSTSGPWSTVGGWWNSSWGARRKITFDNSVSTTALADLTVLVTLTSSNIDYSKTQNSGQDLRFLDADDSTVLSHEIEKWDESGTSYVWVKVPQIDAASTTDHIYMYFDNAGASDGQAATSTFDSNAKMVQHLEETAACATTFTDSTSNANNGSCGNTPTATTGKIAGGRAFNGSNQYIGVPDSSSLSPTNQLTVSAWVNQSSLSANKGIVGKWTYTGGSHGPWVLQTGGSSDTLRVFVAASSSDSGSNYADTAASTWTTGWHHVTFTYDGSGATNADKLKLYIDGVAKTLTFNGTIPTSLVDGTGPLRIGDFENLSRFFNGSIDQVVVEGTTRSADWIKATFQSQNGSYNTFGSEEAPTTIGAWRYYDNATPTDGSTVSSTLLTGSTTAQSYVESNPSALNPNAINTSDVAEWDFSLNPADITIDTTYYFRLVRGDGSAFSSYSTYPQITFARSYTQSAYGWYSNANSVQPGTALSSESTYATISTTSSPVRLRTQLSLGANALPSSTQQFSIQSATSTSGPWTTVGTDWWSPSWGARRKITFDNSSSTTDLTSVPILVSLSASNIDYSKTQNSGQDIRFVDADGGTLLSHEIEKWDETGTSSVWVKVPQIDAGSTTDFIYVYYDNASASDGQAATSVYDSSTKMVQHLEETSACPVTFTDSSSNANNGSCSNSPPTGTGKIGDARFFDNTNKSISVPDSASLSPTSQVTVSAWVNQSSLIADRGIIGKWTYSAGTHGPWALQTGGSSDRLRVFIATDASDVGNNYADTPASSWTTGWHHVAFVYNGLGGTNADRLKIYIDGTLQTLSFTGSMPSALVDGSGPVRIGEFENLNRYFNGTIDEVKIDATARSADWVSAMYRSQNALLSSFGSEVVIGTIAPAWHFYDNASPAHGATLSSALLTGTDTLETYQEGFASPVNPNSVSANQQLELDWSLVPVNATMNTTYYFRVVKTGGTALDTYSVYATLFVGPVLGQEAYRWFANNNSTDVGSGLAAQDTAGTAPSAGTPFRLRTLVHVSGRQYDVGAPSLKLQVAQRSGTCDTGFSGETYADVATGSGDIRYYDNATPADGATVTSNAGDPASGHTKVMQTYEEQNNATTVSQIPSGQDGEWDFSLTVDSGAPVSTAYCFRIVRSDGLLLDSYTVVPQITSAATNIAPNTPSSLAQKTTGDVNISTGAWHNSTSVKFTADLSDTDNPDNLSLCVEAVSISTAFTGTETACGTGVAYSGSAAAASVTIVLSSGTQYHWQARTKDTGGLYSSWVSYGGNSDGSPPGTPADVDVGIDTAVPTTGSVYDGTSAGVDATFNSGSLTSLSANWSGFSDAASGINRYEYTIGTTVGGSDIKSATSVATATSVTANSLSLQTNQIYYFRITAYDNAGNSAYVDANGQYVAPTLALGASSSVLQFADLGSANSYTDSQDLTFTVTTNSYNGYELRQYAAGLLSSGAATISMYAGTWADPTAWTGAGFGYTSTDTLVSGVNRFNGATEYAGVKNGAPGDVIADSSTTAVSGDPHTVTYKLAVTSSQTAGYYTGALVLSAVANF